jgi:hypothetical protein
MGIKRPHETIHLHAQDGQVGALRYVQNGGGSDGGFSIPQTLANFLTAWATGSGAWKKRKEIIYL